MTKKLFRLGEVVLFTTLMIVTSCKKDDEVILSDQNAITSFNLTSGDFTKDFEVRGTTIAGEIPFNVDNANIRLLITVSDKATITPDPNTITSIVNPINFVVTAENGEEKNYVVNIGKELSPENSLLTLELTSGEFIKDFEINADSTVIEGEVPHTIDNADVAISISISDKATITPDPSTITSIADPIIFVVTAENGEEKEYVLDIKRELSPENSLITIGLTSGEFTRNFEINVDTSTIEGDVPYTIDNEDVLLAITIADRAKIAPDPSTITSIVDPIIFVVTAENGDTKEYVVDIKRELSPENSMVSFKLNTNIFEAELDINEEMGAIDQRVLPGTDLTAINTVVITSDRAVITPDPETISDYSSPVAYTVTAENGDVKEYMVTLTLMDEDFMAQCDIMNASKWFGGDDRVVPENPDIGPRNVGTGQTIRLEKDLYPKSFGVHLGNPFRYDSSGSQYLGDLELKLNIRKTDGTVIGSKNVMVNGPFTGGWVDFDLSSLNLILKKDISYFFTWYLVDGESLGISNGSDGNLNVDTGICGATGLSGTSKESEETSLEDWSNWYSHEWHFNFRLEGKQ